MSLEIEWNKVLTQAVTTVVVGVFASACVIVWKGATTVGDRVSESEAKIVHLINGVSDEFSKAQAETKKELSQLRIDMSNSLHTPVVYGPPTLQQMQETEKATAALENSFNIEQKAIKADLIDKLQYKK